MHQVYPPKDSIAVVIPCLDRSVNVLVGQSKHPAASRRVLRFGVNRRTLCRTALELFCSPRMRSAGHRIFSFDTDAVGPNEMNVAFNT